MFRPGARGPPGAALPARRGAPAPGAAGAAGGGGETRRGDGLPPLGLPGGSSRGSRPGRGHGPAVQAGRGCTVSAPAVPGHVLDVAPRFALVFRAPLFPGQCSPWLQTPVVPGGPKSLEWGSPLGAEKLLVVRLILPGPLWVVRDVIGAIEAPGGIGTGIPVSQLTTFHVGFQ